MRTFLRSKVTLLFMTCAVLLAIPAVALADDVYNNLDTSIDADKESITLTEGGTNDTASVLISPTGSDGKSGCNLTGGTSLKVKAVSTDATKVTASLVDPNNTSLAKDTFTSCGDSIKVKVAALAATGSTPVTISLEQVSNTTAGSFNLAPASFNVTVNSAKQNQTISFANDTPTSKTFGDANFNVSATATSGLTVSYAAKAGSSCTVSSAGLVSLTGAGTCTVVASQGGNASYNAAPDVEHAITVGKATPSITWANPADIIYGTALSGTQLNATAQGVGGGSLNGTFDYTPASGAVLDAGTHQLSTTFTPANTTDYTNADANVSLTVNSKPITGSFTADDKVYDGNTDATVLTRSLNGVIGNDVVTLNGGTASFDDKNVGTGKTVTLAGATLSGADKDNYSLSSVNTTTADITARDLTVSATGQNKVYDGNADATVTLSSDKLANDAVTLSNTGASFADKNVGTGKTVTVSGISISGGADAGNYDLTNTTATTTADITPLGITGSFTAADKVWDGTTAATVTGRSLIGVIGNDEVSLNGGTATFDNANVGTGKTVTLAGATLAGADKDNYSLSSVNTAKASILAWTTKGFFQPVDMGGVFNTVKGGSTVPLKFELFSGATELTDTNSVKSLQSQKVNCTSGAEDAIEELAATGGTSLRYDTTGGQFIYNWKTPTGAGCYKVTVTAQDNTPITAYFKTK